MSLTLRLQSWYPQLSNLLASTQRFKGNITFVATVGRAGHLESGSENAAEGSRSRGGYQIFRFALK
jgi:hypothetical protein